MDKSRETASNMLVKTVNNWHCARAVFSEFVAAHPELGLKDSPVTFRNFCYRHGRALMSLGVMRKPTGLRSPAIFDVEHFDRIAFELVTLSSTDVPMPPISDEKKLPMAALPITTNQHMSNETSTATSSGVNHGYS